MIRVCSGWNPKGLILYGHKFLQTFDKYWAAEIELQVYVEEPHPMPRDACRSLWDIPGAREMMIKTDTLRHRGMDTSHGRWKKSALDAGCHFKWNARKFFKQILIPQQASLDMRDGDILVWLDGDVVTTAQTSVSFIEWIIGNFDVAYLGRVNSHAEIGFYAVRINDRTRAFLADMAAIYTSGEFESLPETHSSFIFGTALARAGLKEKNLTPGGRGHVWPSSPLARISVHNKGSRKGVEK